MQPIHQTRERSELHCFNHGMAIGTSMFEMQLVMCRDGPVCDDGYVREEGAADNEHPSSGILLHRLHRAIESQVATPFR